MTSTHFARALAVAHEHLQTAHSEHYDHHTEEAHDHAYFHLKNLPAAADERRKLLLAIHASVRESLAEKGVPVVTKPGAPGVRVGHSHGVITIYDNGPHED